MMHIRDLVLYEASSGLKMATGLTTSDVDFSRLQNNFDKMKVGNSTKYFNHQVAAALKVYSIQMNRPEVLTTAFFIENVAEWFKIVTSRNLQTALSRKSPADYDRTVQFLNTFRCFIFRCKVGEKAYWKPWQAAMIMATDSLLRLQRYFLDRGYDFVLLARFTQDCVENIFSQLRAKCKTPRALQVKDNLKLITIGQIMEEVANSSYSYDPKEWLVSFSDKLNTARTTVPESTIPTVHIGNYWNATNNIGTFQASEENSIYYVAGVVLRSLLNRGTICDQCIKSCTDGNRNTGDLALLTSFRDYNGNALIYINLETYVFFSALEKIFAQNIVFLQTIKYDVNTFLYNLMIKVEAKHFASCHNIKDKIVNRFIIFRLRSSSTKPAREKRYDSKSMF
ncbi:uncharacterized protein LOC131682351 [Topomyia yanbarensis]|uniref:uncharacterized protein LOC131682351 n=1 Tax=Topomyia yanbarensis TaxID=2498891 RepID=UPI00273C0C87|nr:uncharacterized protein LOC131682351 [Topomyia yanbarensis]